jgi:hypothetical protein
VAKRSGDTALARTSVTKQTKAPRTHESGVALRFPPLS